jgi:simple sugar transport system permease protein
MSKRSTMTMVVATLTALAIAVGLGGLFIAATGRSAVDIYALLLRETFTTWYGIGQVLFKATTLIFTGLSAALCFRAGLFNIGGEGQMIAGAFLSALVGFSLPGFPPMLLIPLCFAAAFLGGALWGFVPGLLKARFGAHEVINTIMMNFIAAAVVSYLVNSVYAVPATMHTPLVDPAAQVPRLDQFVEGFRGSPVNASLLVALGTSLLLTLFLWRTVPGFELRALGLNASAAEAAGINLRTRTVLAMSLGGGLAGLGGTNFVLGYKHYYEMGFSDGAGFLGIAVALVARNHPLAILPAAFLFGVLEYGGLTINAVVPKELVTILQGLTILSVVVCTKLMVRLLDRMPAAATAGPGPADPGVRSV